MGRSGMLAAMWHRNDDRGSEALYRVDQNILLIKSSLLAIKAKEIFLPNCKT